MPLTRCCSNPTTHVDIFRCTQCSYHGEFTETHDAEYHNNPVTWSTFTEDAESFVADDDEDDDYEEPPLHWYQNSQDYDCGPCTYCQQQINSDILSEDSGAVRRADRNLGSMERDLRSLNIDDEEPSTRKSNCRCETHKLMLFGESKLKSAVIESYSYEPSWKRFNTTRWIVDKSTFNSTRVYDPFNYYLGIELETDSYYRSKGGVERFSKISPDVAADMRRPNNNGFWIPKSDSSISGPEFVSHPATLAYWRSIRPQLNQMFKMLLHAGYRSYDNNMCGMHINISPNAFNNAEHLYRFLTILHIDPKWSLVMSQRTFNTMSTWASPKHTKPTKNRQMICDQGMDGRAPDYHSTMLNFPDGGGRRFEFRLPRGTLRIDRFYKNLEWTVAMIEYSRKERLRDCSPTKFTRWVHKNWMKYPTLSAYLKEKSGVLDRSQRS